MFCFEHTEIIKFRATILVRTNVLHIAGIFCIRIVESRNEEHCSVTKLHFLRYNANCAPKKDLFAPEKNFGAPYFVLHSRKYHLGNISEIY